MTPMNLPSLDLSLLAPELILLVGGFVVLLGGLRRKLHGAHNLGWTAMLVTALALYKSIDCDAVVAGESGPLILLDSLTAFARWAALGVGLLILLVNLHVPDAREKGEYYSLILFSLLGLLLVAVANDLILLFLALELVSVPTYVLIALSRRDLRAQESTGKYFFLGAFAAALTLYGLSFLYGAAGTMRMTGGDNSITAFAAGLANPVDDGYLLIGLLLVVLGLCFKIAAVPLHFYAADVYQGAASPVAGLLGFVPKFAGFLALIRLFSLFGWNFDERLFWLMWVLAAATMTVGNTLALWQHNARRMLAYSSVAHSGYVLVGLLAAAGLARGGPADGVQNGLTAVLFYLVVYGVTNLGAFAALSWFRKPADDPHADADNSVESLDDLAGAARHHPWAALALSVCVLGLMGFPLTAGFYGKLSLFSAALAAGEPLGRPTEMLVLVIIAALNAAVAAAYYLRILASCYLREPAAGVQPSRDRALALSLALCALIVLAVFFRPGRLLDLAQAAVADVTPVRISEARVAAGTE